MYEQSQQAFIRALDIHIRLLTLNYLKHKATEETYDFLFDLMHEIGEKYESVGRRITEDNSPENMITELYGIVEGLKDDLTIEISQEEDEGVKNLLLSKLDGIQTICAKLKSL